jgi:hypothetical protein
MPQVLFFLRRPIVAIPVHLDDEFAVQQREIGEILEVPKWILMTIALTKRGNCGL